ncbi:hypothetical protein SAMN05519104_6661 [Rhizobiales bacterium GAS188]|nr:hypothetical protein SAMN05519104_6661 [Rhizobiales bacterium GAS188]
MAEETKMLVELGYNVTLQAAAGEIVIRTELGPMAMLFKLAPQHFAQLLKIGAEKIEEAMRQRQILDMQAAGVPMPGGQGNEECEKVPLSRYPINKEDWDDYDYGEFGDQEDPLER